MNRACFSSVTGMRLAGGTCGRATRQRIAGPTAARARYPVGYPARHTTPWGKRTLDGPRSHCDGGALRKLLRLGGRRGNLSVDPRKSLSPPGVTGVRADPPAPRLTYPYPYHRASELPTEARFPTQATARLASHLRIEERELEAGGLN